MKFFALKYFMKIFHEIFQKFHCFFRLYTHPFDIFYTSNITFHSFMNTAAPYAYLLAYLHVCLFKYG